jgi:hypothetical protein
LSQLSLVRKVFENFVTGTPCKLAFLIGVALRIPAGDGVTAAVHIPIVDKHDLCPRRKSGVEHVEERRTLGFPQVRPPKACKPGSEMTGDIVQSEN